MSSKNSKIPGGASVNEPELGRQAWRKAWLNFIKASMELLDATAGLLPRAVPLGVLLFGLGIVVYLFTRLYRIGDYPIYFFGDEAAQALYAERLIESGFQDSLGIWFPVYIQAAASRWTPLLAMYFHAVSLTLFGKSVFVTRATSALISLLAGLSISLTLRDIFKIRFWWVGILLAGLTPAFFLHSRTAFETVMTTAFFGTFLYFYLMYRCRSPIFLYPAIVMGAATFYTYSNAQAVMAAAAGLLFLSDLRYHLRHWKHLGSGLALGLLMAVPLIAFQINLPDAVSEHLRMVNSYWVQPIPLLEKLALFSQKYAYGISPGYWFFPNQHDLVRHRMLGYGQIHTLLLPVFILGLGISLWKMRSAPYRAVILAGLAAPVGAALLEIGIPRVLSFIIPANILIGLGCSWLLHRLEKRIPTRLVSWGMFIVLSGANLLLLNNALTKGPLWFRDYGLYGMQYGARQIFDQAIPALLEDNPNIQVLVTSTWANGTDNFLNFFLPEDQRQQVRMDGVEAYLFKHKPLTDEMVFIMTPAEYQKALESEKFKRVDLAGLIPYPDGTPGFYLARLTYSDRVDEIFAAEKEARSQLVEDQVEIDGEILGIKHSQIDMGAPILIFDGDHFSLMRGLEANPFILEINFLTPRPVSGLEADFGLVDIRLTVALNPAGDDSNAVYTISRQKVTDPIVKMTFENPPNQVIGVRIEIFNLFSGETANIHIRELHLLP